MAYFEKLDISVFSFFDEMTDPMIVFSEEQIVFVNKFWRENFQFEFKKWQEFVNSSKSQNELYRFFMVGGIPETNFYRSLKGKSGLLSRFHWTFVNLTSNSDQRYCLAKGKKQITLSELMQTDLKERDFEIEGLDLKFVKAILRNSHDMMAILDQNGYFKFVSSSIIDKLGIDPESIIGKSIHDFVDDGKIEVVEGNLDLQWSGRKEKKVDLWVKREGGKNFFLQCFAKNLLDEPAVEGILLSARDITELKKTQKALREAKEKAEQASIIKSQFLSVMSHEIRTPMNAVIGMAHLLLDDNPRKDQLENLKTLQFSAENLLGLINDILDYTKIDSGKVELENVGFDVKNVINRIIHSYSYQAKEKALDIFFEVDEKVPIELKGDPVRLGQIVNNLVSNAVKFTHKGFLRISLKAVEENKDQVVIQFDFEDSGIGIPVEKRASVFEAFTQASAETTRKYGGTGLGLAIVKKLVDLFGGNIDLKDKKSGGTIFSFTIKFQKAKNSLTTFVKPTIISHKNLKFTKILVAEDNIVNQVMIQKFLIKWGVNEIIMASNGKEAINEIDSHYFNLVLLDLQMPEMDGFEVASYLRSHFEPEKRKTPIIALTASSLVDLKLKLQNIGMDDLISKPFNPDDLHAKIMKYVVI